MHETTRKIKCQKQTFNQAMKGNQNLLNRQVTSNNMTGKPLPISHCSRSKSREHCNNSRHISQTNSHNLTQNLTTVIAILSHRVEVVHHNQDHKIFKLIQTTILEYNHFTTIEMETVHADHSHEIDFVLLQSILIRL